MQKANHSLIHWPSKRTHAGGFTLIELLVGIAIVSTLLAVTVTSLSGAREQARRVVCLTNMRALAFAVGSYANENADWLPPSAQRYDGRDHLELSANIVTNRNVGYDLTELLGMHVPEGAFSCPSVPGPLVTDPANSADLIFTNYIFLWGAAIDTPLGGPRRMSDQANSVAVADFTWYALDDDLVPVFGGNHAKRGARTGSIPEADLSTNPSALQFVRRQTPRHLTGLNAARLSGSAAWYKPTRNNWTAAGPYNQASARYSAVYLPSR
jgi:prepilin-type N-terminal cleavage/methylation domain-containing protein